MDNDLYDITNNNRTLVNIDEIYNLVKKIDTGTIKESSKEFIRNSLEGFFLKTEFNGLYSYATIGDDNYDTPRNISCCIIPEDKLNTYLGAFHLKFLSFPLFWKDYICMFYIALKQFSNIQSNSRVICLGESPMKIVLIQEFFFKNEVIRDAMITKKYATNVSFEYFSMSRLQKIINNINSGTDMKQKYSEIHALFEKGDVSGLNVQIIKKFISRKTLSYLNNKENSFKSTVNKIKNHFTCWNLNPRRILNDNKLVYFEDRCENYTSALGLIYHYIQLCKEEGLTGEERKKIYDLLYIVGYDSKNESDETFNKDKITLYCINYLMYYLFCSPNMDKEYIDDYEALKPLNEDKLSLNFCSSKLITDFHFIQVNYYNKTKYSAPAGVTPDDYFIAEIKKDLFFSQKDSLDNIISFISVPEFGQNNTRCIQGVNLTTNNNRDDKRYEDVQCSSNTNVKQQGVPGLNCNWFNFFIIYYLNQLAIDADSILSDMVLNLSSIDETEIFNNSTYNKDIFGDNVVADQWWADVNTEITNKYNAQLALYKEKINACLEPDIENTNYFTDLIKMIDVQRMIGTIRINSTLTDVQYIRDKLFAKESNIPANSKRFIYNGDYKKIFKKGNSALMAAVSDTPESATKSATSSPAKSRSMPAASNTPAKKSVTPVISLVSTPPPVSRSMPAASNTSVKSVAPAVLLNSRVKVPQYQPPALRPKVKTQISTLMPATGGAIFKRSRTMEHLRTARKRTARKRTAHQKASHTKRKSKRQPKK